MTSALMPWDSEEDMIAACTGDADLEEPSSFWKDEVDEEGNVSRSAARAAGTEDLHDWARAVAVALVQSEHDKSTLAGDQDEEQPGGSIKFVNRHTEPQEDDDDDEELAEPTDTVSALIAARFGPDATTALDDEFSDEERDNLNTMAARAVADAAFLEQVGPPVDLQHAVLVSNHSNS
jgi:hypothetical protein